MVNETITDAKLRLLQRLKRTGPVTVGALSAALGMTDVAVRQHLQSLEAAGRVRQEKRAAAGRGRPSMLWAVTELTNQLFPDRHGELTVSLIEAVRKVFGDEGLSRVVEVRSREQVDQYLGVMPQAEAPLGERVEALARERSAEGYMAEVKEEQPGCFMLIEHHCPVCEAARSCTGLCAAELGVFREVLGRGVSVERTSHLLSGDLRCIYRIRDEASCG